MNNLNKYSAGDLLDTIIEFTQMTPHPEDWSFKSQKNNDPRFVRLQQIMALIWAFTPEIIVKDEREGIEKFYSGEFIFYRKTDDYRKLIGVIDKTISKSDFGFDAKGKPSLHDLQFIYDNLLSYYIKLYKLINHNCGIMEIGYPFSFPYILTKSISDSLSSKAKKIRTILILFIDPFTQKYTKEELINRFFYPEEDLFDIDLDWK
jgi:hypothetical protein